jgi:hypothetical protein
MDPCDEFPGPDGFHHEVVRARVQPLDLLLPAAARGQDDDGRSNAGAAPVSQNLDPGTARQAEVEDEDGDAGKVGPVGGGFTVEGMVDGEAGRLETGRQALGQIGVVLDKQ